MTSKRRNGKYEQYERKILSYLRELLKDRKSNQSFNKYFIGYQAIQIYDTLKIPRTLYYDVIRRMKEKGLITLNQDEYHTINRVDLIKQKSLN